MKTNEVWPRPSRRSCPGLPRGPCAVEPPPLREQEPGLPQGGHGSLGADGLFLLSLILPAVNQRLSTVLRSEGLEAETWLPLLHRRTGGGTAPTPHLGSS